VSELSGKTKTEKVKKKFRQRLSQFQDFINVIRPKPDFKGKIKQFVNPENPQTITKLSPSQADAIAIANFVSVAFPEFEPLKEFADELSKAYRNIDGWSTNKAIESLQSDKQERNLKLEFREQPDETGGK
jgi:hypothetical protein